MATFKQYTKKDGSKHWKFQAYLGTNPATGKPIKTTRSNFKTKKAAQLELSRLKVEFDKKGLQKKSNETFQNLYKLWFESYKTTVREATSLVTEMNIKNHVLPVIGRMRVSQISPIVAQDLVNSLSKKLKQYKVIVQYLVKIMELGVTLEIIEKNPFIRVTRPKEITDDPEVKRIKFYTMDEVEKVFTHLNNKVSEVKNNNPLYKYFAEWDLVMYRVLAFTGIRGGEALAHDWETDIDFNQQTLSISKTVTRTKDGFEIGPPKTKSSYRTIRLDNKTCQILKKWRLHQKEFFFQSNIKNKNIVFASFEGEHATRQSLYMRSKRLSEAVGLPNIGTHGWRHTHASMLYQAGIDMKEAQEILGHASIEITNNIYTHVSQKQKIATADKLANFASF